MKNRNKLIYWIRGIIMAFAITSIAILVISLLLIFTNLRESRLPMLNNIIMILSITISSIYLAMKAKEKGWINGAILGLTYYLIIILLGVLIIRPITLDMVTWAKLFVAGLIGSIGGMIGINLI